MELGLQVANFTWPGGSASIGPTFGAIARNAEAAGLKSLWVMDHFFQIGVVGPPEHDMLEGYTALAFAAGQTSTIELGTLVTGVTYRHPGLLLKTVTSLDVLSGGRAWLGIGAAWNEHEHRGLGVPYPPTAERFERLEETLQIALQMWRDDNSPYEGSHYRLERTLNVPQALRRPHPPIMVGGMGEQKTLRLVARYADACNIFDLGPDGVRAKYDVIDRHCADVGRDPADITRTVLCQLSLAAGGDGSTSAGQPLSVAQAVDKLGALAAVGTDTVILLMPDTHEEAVYEPVADLVRQVEPL